MTKADRPVVVRLASGVEYGVRNAADAKRIYPNATIVRYQDGSAFEDDAADAAPNLDSMSRDELNAYAGKLGIENADDRDAFPNKGAVIAAIEDAQA